MHRIGEDGCHDDHLKNRVKKNSYPHLAERESRLEEHAQEECVNHGVVAVNRSRKKLIGLEDEVVAVDAREKEQQDRNPAAEYDKQIYNVGARTMPA